MNFLHLIFPCMNLFSVLRPPPPPHNFSNGPSLTPLFKQVEASDPRWSEMGVFPPTWLIRDTDDCEIFRMRRNLAGT